MEFSSNLEYVTIFDKRSRVATLAGRLANLSATQVKEFFANRDIKLPRRINMLALMSVLNEKIKTLNSQSLTKDMFTKLQFYKDFNEFQLQTLFEKICDEEDFLNYRISLWTLILKNHDSLNLLDGEVQYLSKIKKLKVDDFSSFERIIFEICEDVNKEFDGVLVKNAEQLFNNSFSSDELRRLAEKYGFIISSRLKKNEFTDFVKQILKSKRKLTVALGKEIDEMTVVQLNSLCELHEITLSSNLKKHEIIYLIMFLIKANKLSTSELKGISTNGGITPLEFTVDLDSIDNFGRGQAKDVIILPQEEVFEEEPTEEDKPMTQEDLIKEIAKKLGLIPEEEKEEVKEEPVIKQPKPVKQASESNGKMTPAERLALARKRKQELAEQRRLEEQGLPVAEPVKEEKPVVKQPKPVIEEETIVEEDKPAIDVQALINRLRSKNSNPVKEEPVVEEETPVVTPAPVLEEEPIHEEQVELVEEDFEDDLDLEDVKVLDEVEENEVEEVLTEPVVEETLSEEVSEENIEEDTLVEEPIETDVEESIPSNDTEETVEEIKEEPVSKKELKRNRKNEKVAKKSKNKEIVKDETYDAEFNPAEFVEKNEVIENPYYQSKKLNSKKKAVLRAILYSIGLIAVFCVGVIASRFLK